MGKEKLILFCNESDAGQSYICGGGVKKHLNSASQHTQAEGLYKVQEIDREAIFKEKRVKYKFLSETDSRLRMTDAKLLDRDVSIEDSILKTDIDRDRLKIKRKHFHYTMRWEIVEKSVKLTLRSRMTSNL